MPGNVYCPITITTGFETMSRGVKLIYLPAYSPDYNPIEEMFSFVKAYIRRHGEQFRAAVEFGDEASPYVFLYEALSDITTSRARGWFNHCGYM
jgi:hypothetical protein